MHLWSLIFSRSLRGKWGKMILNIPFLSLPPAHTLKLGSINWAKDRRENDRFFSIMKIKKLVDQIANICWIIKKAREWQKNIYFHFIEYAKAFDCVNHNKLWKILQEKGIPDHLTCLLRNLYAGQEATVRTGHGKTDWLQIRKGVHQGCILSLCLLNFIQSTSCEMPGWMKHKLESIVLGGI